jgi:hypothetical protein
VLGRDGRAGGRARDLVPDRRDDVGPREDLAEDPRERDRRRVVAGEQHGHQRVADLGVGDRLSRRVAGPQQVVEHVVTRGRAADLGAPTPQVLVKLRVDPPQLAVVGQPRHAAEERVRGDARHHQRERQPPVREHPRDLASELRAGAALDAQHDLQDAAQRDRTHRLLDRERLPLRPRRDRLGRRADHPVDVGAHALAVQRRDEDRALRRVLRLVEHEHRARADDLAQERVPLARMERGGIAAEDVSDRRRSREHHELPESGEPHREGRPEFLRARLEEFRGMRRVPDQLQQRGRARSRGQRCGGGHRTLRSATRGVA